MRQFKFRIWHEDVGEYFYLDLMRVTESGFGWTEDFEKVKTKLKILRQAKQEISAIVYMPQVFFFGDICCNYPKLYLLQRIAAHKIEWGVLLLNCKMKH